MNSNQLKYIVAALLFCSAVSCKKFVEKDDVNINPNKPSFVTLNTLLPAVEYVTANNHALVGYITTMFSQQMAAYQSGPINEDQNRDVRTSTGYSGLYQNGMTNAKILVELGKTQGSPHYAAIGRILFVTNLALATDTWGDVPLKEAFQSPAILYPAYDSQQEIYAFMQAYLDSAITETGQSNPATLKPGADDLIYGGDITAWKQTAYFLKARLYMHTTKKGAVAAATSVLAALANGFTAASKDYQVIYSDKNPNPWYVNVSGRISGSATFTIAPSKRFTDALNGTAYLGLFDPRINAIIFKKPTLAAYIGIPNGTGATGNTVDLTDVTYYAQKTAPLVMGSYAEQKLMEAEARFIVNGGSATSTGSTQAAYDAYIAGVGANLKKVGIDTATGSLGKAYLTHPQVAVGAAGLKLEHILRERQVALFLNLEAWTDMRRYDYNPALFRGVALPANQNAELGGQFIRRALYPLDEVNRNPKAAAALKKMSDKMWWDQ